MADIRKEELEDNDLFEWKTEHESKCQKITMLQQRCWLRSVGRGLDT